MKECVRAFASHLDAREAALGLRRRRRDREALDTFRLAAEAVCCSLVWSTVDPLGRPVAVPRDAALLRGRSRYRPACYGQGLTDVLALAARPEVALVEDLSRGFRYPSGDSAPSTIKPTAAFLARFVPIAITWQDFARAPEAEVLVLKAPKVAGADTGVPIEYADTEVTRRLRRQVQHINRVLTKTPFWFAEDAGPVGLTKLGEPVDPAKRTVRRIFNNGSWSEGGRLFGGVWQSLRRADRFRLLRMASPEHPEGEPAANVDFQSLNPVLCYSLDRLPVPDGDLYDIRGDGSDRGAFKILMSAMLFARGRFHQLPVGARKAFPPGTLTRDVVSAVERFHAPIAHRFWCGHGHRLAYAESSILIEALAGLERQGVPALPLHDSVLVPRSCAERAQNILQSAFSQYVDSHRAAVKIDYGEHYQ